jgi:hypothetical protein
MPGDKGNENQKYIKIPPRSSQKVYHQDIQTTTNVGKDEGKKKPLYTVGENVN